MTNENRVAFFDEFIKRNFLDWRFETVTKVELKRYEGSEDDETKELDEEEDSALSNLQGITSAILSGTSFGIIHLCKSVCKMIFILQLWDINLRV